MDKSFIVINIIGCHKHRGIRVHSCPVAKTILNHFGKFLVYQTYFNVHGTSPLARATPHTTSAEMHGADYIPGKVPLTMLAGTDPLRLVFVDNTYIAVA